MFAAPLSADLGPLHPASITLATLAFPGWIRFTHLLNILFITFMMRSGIQILASLPKLYWNEHCTPGAELLSSPGQHDSSRIAFRLVDRQQSPLWEMILDVWKARAVNLRPDLGLGTVAFEPWSPPEAGNPGTRSRGILRAASSWVSPWPGRADER
ncbi:MAG: hypothetical protein ACR2MY_07910 [Candidatus Dormibacteria bacterium]